MIKLIITAEANLPMPVEIMNLTSLKLFLRPTASSQICNRKWEIEIGKMLIEAEKISRSNATLIDAATDVVLCMLDRRSKIDSFLILIGNVNMVNWSGQEYCDWITSKRYCHSPTVHRLIWCLLISSTCFLHDSCFLDGKSFYHSRN